MRNTPAHKHTYTYTIYQYIYINSMQHCLFLHSVSMTGIVLLHLTLASVSTHINTHESFGHVFFLDRLPFDDKPSKSIITSFSCVLSCCTNNCREFPFLLPLLWETRKKMFNFLWKTKICITLYETVFYQFWIPLGKKEISSITARIKWYPLYIYWAFVKWMEENVYIACVCVYASTC